MSRYLILFFFNSFNLNCAEYKGEKLSQYLSVECVVFKFLNYLVFIDLLIFFSLRFFIFVLFLFLDMTQDPVIMTVLDARRTKDEINPLCFSESIYYFYGTQSTVVAHNFYFNLICGNKTQTKNENKILNFLLLKLKTNNPFYNI